MIRCVMAERPLVELATCQEALRESVAREVRTGARVVVLEAALRALVSRLDAVHAHPAYMSVWQISQIHVGPYRGPTYTEALAQAREALEGKPS